MGATAKPSTMIVIEVHPDCERCLRSHVESMQLTAEIKADDQVRPGDLIIVPAEGAALAFGRVLCNGTRCTLNQAKQFERILERLANGDYPDYGSLYWDGEHRTVELTVLFDDGSGASDDVVRRRALRYLESLTPEERAAVKLEVSFRDHRPVRAVVRAQSGQFSAARLRELARRT